MSLVHEALRKAEREKQRKSGTLPVAATEPHASIPRAQPIPTPKLQPPSPAPQRNEPAAPLAPRKSHSVLMAVLISCVSIVAIVAIVILVTRQAATIREADSAMTTTPQKPVAANTHTPPTAGASDQSEPAQPATPSPSSPYRITGIMTDPSSGKFSAVLNGRTVSEGYYVDGATVKSISRNQVTLTLDNGREIVVRLF
jgi:cytoskeletal protein RodZ